MAALIKIGHLVYTASLDFNNLAGNRCRYDFWQTVYTATPAFNNLAKNGCRSENWTLTYDE